MEDTNSHPSAIDKLTDDCLEMIFWKLPIHDRAQLERVCKRFKFISERSWSNIKAMFLHDKFDSPYMHRTESISFNSRSGRNYQFDPALVKKAFPLCGRYLHQLDLGKYLASSRDAVGFSKLIAKHCCNLRELQISDFSESEDVELIFSTCKKLEKVYVEFNHLNDVKCLEKLSKERIRVIGTSSTLNHNLTEAFTQTIRNFPNLHTVLIKGFDVDLTWSLELFAENKSIRRLEFVNCQLIYRTKLISVQNFKNLEHLTLISVDNRQSEITDDVVSRLAAKAPKLKSLYLSNDIKYRYSILRKGMSAIGDLRDLELLAIRDLPIDINSMEMMPALRFICYKNQRNDMETEKKLISSLLVHAPNLEYLVYPQMTEQLLDLVNEFIRLRTNNLELRVFVDNHLARRFVELEYKSELLKISSCYDYIELKSLCSIWYQGIDYNDFKRACTMKYCK